MATTFDEVILDTAYGADGAEGGPEFATVIIRSGEGGAVAARNQNREDFVSRYSIEFGMLSPERRSALRAFAILREGMSRGFRFVAPDDCELVNEHVGWFNPASGEIEARFTCDGVLTEFYLIQYLSDQANSYTRRIIKPSPVDDLTINIFNTSNVNTPAIFPAGAGVGAFGVILETITTTINIPATVHIQINFHRGIITTSPALPSGFSISVTGIYHVPVAFSQDWQKFAIDDAGVSEFKIQLEELLPTELGFA